MRLLTTIAALFLAFAATDGPFDWPTGGPVAVIRGFDPPAVPWAAGHRGVDLALPPGSTVVAAGAGRVVYAGTLAGRGVVSIEHPSGMRTTYEPVTASVSRGNAVAAGQPIGTLDGGHCPDGCLHLGARHGKDHYIDPLSLFAEIKVRLVPLGGTRPR